jgi:hypothetical protein
MKFNEVNIYGNCNPGKPIVTFYASNCEKYEVMDSLTGQGWLAFFIKDGHPSLIKASLQSKEEAMLICVEHAADLPW